jgi:hypothetical protein
VRLIGTEEVLTHDHLWTPQQVSIARSSGDSFYMKSSQIPEKAYVHCMLCFGCSQIQTLESDSMDPTLMIDALPSPQWTTLLAIGVVGLAVMRRRLMGGIDDRQDGRLQWMRQPGPSVIVIPAQNVQKQYQLDDSIAVNVSQTL